MSTGIGTGHGAYVTFNDGTEDVAHYPVTGMRLHGWAGRAVPIPILNGEAWGSGPLAYNWGMRYTQGDRWEISPVELSVLIETTTFAIPFVTESPYQTTIDLPIRAGQNRNGQWAGTAWIISMHFGDLRTNEAQRGLIVFQWTAPPVYAVEN